MGDRKPEPSGPETRADPGVSQEPAHSFRQDDWSGTFQSFSQAAVEHGEQGAMGAHGNPAGADGELLKGHAR